MSCSRSLFLLAVVPLVLAFAQPSRAVAERDDTDSPPADQRHLVGAIGTTGVRLSLNRDGSKLSGSYAYERAKPTLLTVLETLWLDGTVTPDGHFELEETVTDAQGHDSTTGVLKGTLVDGPNGMKIDGTWSRPDGSKPLPLTAVETRVTSGGLRVSKATYDALTPRFRKIVSAAYPAFGGVSSPKVTALNAEVLRTVKRLVTDFVDSVQEDAPADGAEADADADSHLALDVTYEVTSLSDGFVSMRFEIYNDFGGSHPSSFVETLNFDLRTGRVVGLADVFKKGSPYLRALAAKSRTLFAGGDFDAAADTSPKAENYHTWYVTRRGLTIVFEVPHVIGDTAEVYLPFADLDALLDPSGPVSSATK